jgi:hypothetical protein
VGFYTVADGNTFPEINVIAHLLLTLLNIRVGGVFPKTLEMSRKN